MARRSLDHGETMALQVALSLIDDISGDADCIFGHDSRDDDASVDSGGSSKPDEDVNDNEESDLTGNTTLAKPIRKRRRNRRKDEIDYLRAKVVDLEQSLDATKNRIAEAQGIDLAQVELMSIWEEFSTRQQRKRQASEVENAKLRSMLESQVEVAKQLMQFLEKQPREEDIPGVRALKRLQVTPDNILALSHDQLVKRMDAQYATTASIFDADDEWTKRRTFRNVRVRDENSDMGVVEIHTAWVLPFDLSLVARVLTQRAERITLETRCQHFETLEMQDGLIQSLFHGAAENAEGAVVEVNGRLVTKLYAEPLNDQAVIVSELCVEPVDAATAKFPPFGVQSQGWIRILPYKPAGKPLNSATTTHLTHIQWFRRVRIMPRPVNGVIQRRQPGMFTELVLSHIADDLDQSQHVIEDLVMEGAMAQDGSNSCGSSSSSSSSSTRSSQEGTPCQDEMSANGCKPTLETPPWTLGDAVSETESKHYDAAL